MNAYELFNLTDKLRARTYGSLIEIYGISPFYLL